MLRGLLKGTLDRVAELFDDKESRSTNVATFLALLELVRAGRIRISEDGSLHLDRTRRKRKEGQPHE